MRYLKLDVRKRFQAWFIGVIDPHPCKPDIPERMP